MTSINEIGTFSAKELTQAVHDNLCNLALDVPDEVLPALDDIAAAR
ncbi:hypothetical protein [Halotalea alkalilenta]|nr:hypothetical protein [Halotalea alkalilenta]